MRTLVVGATGMVGGMVARTLHEQGVTVRALVREGADASSLPAGVERVPGDLVDPDSLRRAVIEVDAVIATANSARPRLPHDTVTTVEVDGYASLVGAAADAGVGRFVYLSAYIAQPEAPMEFLRAKAGVEQRLAASGMPFTVVAPGPFDEVWPAMIVGAPVAAGQPVTLMRPANHRHPFVSVRDVAAYCTAVIGRSDAVDQRLAVGGPTSLTWPQVVEVYERVLGRPVETRYVDFGQRLPGTPAFISSMMTGFESADVDIEMAATSAAYGITPTPLESAVAAMATA
jgi:NADH dehydrogenase